MRKRYKSNKSRIISTVMAGVLLASPLQYVEAMEKNQNTIFINEIESDSNEGNDWIEIINAGTTDVDISGWMVSDDKGLERIEDGTTVPFAQGTVLKAGAVLVLEDAVDFDFGLGKNDTANLYDNTQQVQDSYTWQGHAVGTYSRVPDGTGPFVDIQETKGALNKVDNDNTEEETPSKETLVINEINSAPDDWVELMNTGTEDMDISGYEIRDNSDDHRFRLPANTVIKAGELLLVKEDTVGQVYNDQTGSYVDGAFRDAIGIGSGDAIRIYDKEANRIDSYTWTEHASYDGNQSAASYGRYPDGTGSFVVMPETPAAKNTWYAPKIVINEIESDGDATDWVEVYNTGTAPVDISGWYLLDNDPVGHKNDVFPVAEGTIVKPGEFYVFELNSHFTFGLGKSDHVTVFTKDGEPVDDYGWSEHATGVLARVPDGIGEFVDFERSTKGKSNAIVNPVIINEVQSSDPEGKPDWIELANPTSEELDISAIVIKDSEDTNEYSIPTGTTIPANGFIVITADQFGFGLGKNDSVRLYENGILLASTTWIDHTNPTWGLYPDIKGNSYRNTMEPTPGEANKFTGIPELIDWDGKQETAIYDKEPMFLTDSSGLDFYNGQLYAVDNGTGRFWILDVEVDGSLSFVKGFEDGKRVRFQKDADNSKAAGPDAEGITVDQDGFVYIASERDNNVKGVNYNSILKLDPKVEGADLVAIQEWDLTASLPQVAANTGLEAVEWVANSEVVGKLFDQNTKAPFDSSKYPNAIANGVFFVALEDNGHVYAYILNEDGSSVQIADIDGKLGGGMALDYDVYEQVLWLVTDNGYGNVAAKISFTGEAETDIVHVKPPVGVNAALNYEGFAIAEAKYTVGGQRPVYRFEDGVKMGSLLIGSMACNYVENTDSDTTTDVEDPTKPTNPTKPAEPTKPAKPANPANPEGVTDEETSEEVNEALPDTGDRSTTTWMIILLFVCCGAVSTMVFYSKKRNLN